MTQAELAGKTGLSVRAISDLERGVTARPHRASVALLADALGFDPAGHDELAAARRRPRDTALAAGPIVPRQLPAAVHNFVGRAAELCALTGRLDQGEAGSNTVVISAIGGTAGVGKTALAVHWAHQIAGRFPDGQLYVNLRGYDAAAPLAAADVLAAFLRALGLHGDDIPAELDERAARYRSLLAARRVLVMLDNAGSAEQVRPLLPGTPSCTAVVTSRDSLPGLVALDDARRLDLTLLPLAEAVDLLRKLIGGRVDADPGAAASLAVQCCRLPLSLRIAAELAAARPAVPLIGLVGELTDQHRRLDLLKAGGDPRAAVRAVFSWSYRHLDPGDARAFRLLGLHPGQDFDSYAAAAITGTSAGQAQHLVDRLTRVHLIHPVRAGRWGMHDLLRAYAVERAARDDAEADRRAALTRLFDHYLHSAAVAMDTLFPAERHYRPRIPSPAAAASPIANPAAARDWLNEERAGLVAVAAHTAANGWPGHTTRLAATMFRYLDAGGYYSEAAAMHSHAQRAAHQVGDRAAESTALINLGAVDQRQGRPRQATCHLEQAAALCREIGDRQGEARALSTLGNIDLRQGRYAQADHHHQQALALHRGRGDLIGEAHALDNLGIIEMLQGRYPEATLYLRRALALHRDLDDRTGEATVLINLGDICRRQGSYRQAADHLQRALTLSRETGNRQIEAHALTSLGEVGLLQGRPQQASDYQQRALALCREIGELSGEAEALNGLGEALFATGKPGPARTRHTAALALASQIGEQDQQARAHNGLGHCYHAADSARLARRHWQQALAIYTGLGAPEADAVRDHLAAARMAEEGT